MLIKFFLNVPIYLGVNMLIYLFYLLNFWMFRFSIYSRFRNVKFDMLFQYWFMLPFRANFTVVQTDQN